MSRLATFPPAHPDANASIAALLRGEVCGCRCCCLHRQVAADLVAEGYVIVGRDVLVGVAATGPDDGSNARHLALVALLGSDVDFLAEALVEVLWHERSGRQVAA